MSTSSRPTVEASRPTTGRASSSVTRSWTSTGTVATYGSTCATSSRRSSAHSSASSSWDGGSKASPASGSRPPDRKIASIGVHASRWVTTHGYALNVDLDPAPFTDWITACGLEDARFTSIAAELGRPVSVDDVRGPAASALAEVFGLELEERARCLPEHVTAR